MLDAVVILLPGGMVFLSKGSSFGSALSVVAITTSNAEESRLQTKQHCDSHNNARTPLMQHNAYPSEGTVVTSARPLISD